MARRKSTQKAPGGKAIPETGVAVPEAGEAAPEMQEAVPEIPEAAPEAGEAVFDMQEAAPAIPEAVPEAGEALPEEPEAVPGKKAAGGEEKKEGDRAVTVIIAIILIVILAQVVYLWKNLSDTGSSGAKGKGTPQASRRADDRAAPKGAAKGLEAADAKAQPKSGKALPAAGDSGGEPSFPPPDVYVAAFLELQKDEKLALTPPQVKKVLAVLKSLVRFDRLKYYLDESLNQVLTEPQRAFIIKKKEAATDAQSLMAEDRMLDELIAKLRSKAGDVKPAQVPADFVEGSARASYVSLLDFFRAFEEMEKDKSLALTPAQASDFLAAALAFVKGVPKIGDISRDFDAVLTADQKSEFRAKLLPALEKKRDSHRSLITRMTREFVK